MDGEACDCDCGTWPLRAPLLQLAGVKHESVLALKRWRNRAGTIHGNAKLGQIVGASEEEEEEGVRWHLCCQSKHDPELRRRRCAVKQRRGSKDSGRVSQPKALDYSKKNQKKKNLVPAFPRQREQIGTTSGSHFSSCKERKKEIYERGGKRQIFSAMQSRKESGVELHMKVAEKY